MARVIYSDNPVKDFERFDSIQADELSKLPICNCCGEPIQQDKAIYYNDQWVCRECESDFWMDIRDDFLESVEEYA